MILNGNESLEEDEAVTTHEEPILGQEETSTKTTVRRVGGNNGKNV